MLALAFRIKGFLSCFCRGTASLPLITPFNQIPKYIIIAVAQVFHPAFQGSELHALSGSAPKINNIRYNSRNKGDKKEEELLHHRRQQPWPELICVCAGVRLSKFIPPQKTNSVR